MKIFVGYDTREDIAYQVCKHSIESLCPTAEVIPLKQNELRNDKLYWRSEDKLASTEFTFTRFLIPHLMNYDGWALFIDSDIVFTENVKNLFDLADDKYAVMCAQHDYTPKPGTKMDGQVQTQYPRKNWSSVVLWNCGHPSNQQVIPSMVNKETGKFMHRFSWLKDEEIGEISHEWNWLEGWYKEPKDGKPKAIHFTEGGPWFKGKQDVDYANLWIETANKTGTEWSPL